MQELDSTDVDTAVDVVTIVVVSLVLMWSTVLEAMISSTYDTALSRTVLLAYPIADAVLLALVIRALEEGRASWWQVRTVSASSTSTTSST